MCIQFEAPYQIFCTNCVKNSILNREFPNEISYALQKKRFKLRVFNNIIINVPSLGNYSVNVINYLIH
jgi:hypothetical protein